MPDYSLIPRVAIGVGRTTPDGIVQLLGTAFMLNKAGFVATAAHVVGTEDKNLVIAIRPDFDHLGAYQDTGDNRLAVVRASIAAADPFHDLAVLRIESDVSSNIMIGGADDAPPGTPITLFGFPHADHGRLVLTQQDSVVGARILLESGGVKAKHVVLNVQARPGQSGGPVLRQSDGRLVAVLVGSYALGGRDPGLSIGGINPHTLHQTTHAVSAEYLNGMY